LQLRPIGTTLPDEVPPKPLPTAVGASEFSADQIDGIEAEDRHIVLVIRMEVRQMVRRTDFHVHTDDNSKKAAEFWHRVILSAKRISTYRASIVRQNSLAKGRLADEGGGG
jgi:hypothetical protein